jgi:Zn finger protein HypA/HybF involved in hydrogenase expression
MSNSIYERKNNFINNVVIIHGEKYDYSLVEYINAHTKVSILCPIHGEFLQKPNNHQNGQGCPICGSEKQKQSHTNTTQEFINKAKNIHGELYDYSRAKYKGIKQTIRIICKKHGEFLQTPNNHISRKTGCPSCGSESGGKKQSLSVDEFITKARKVHDEVYDYNSVNYKTSKTKISITCHTHGEFLQTPNTHLNGTGCPACARGSNFSNVAIHWLERIMKTENIFIQHAQNLGEYKIPGTKFKADGYCKETNTVYEFYGDKFHGNINLYNTDVECHPFTDATAGELYQKTIERERSIEQMGYNLVTIWENDYSINESF